jgi:hypothetical protein
VSTSAGVVRITGIASANRRDGRVCFGRQEAGELMLPVDLIANAQAVTFRRPAPGVLAYALSYVGFDRRLAAA